MQAFFIDLATYGFNLSNPLDTLSCHYVSQECTWALQGEESLCGKCSQAVFEFSTQTLGWALWQFLIFKIDSWLSTETLLVLFILQLIQVLSSIFFFACPLL